MAAERTGGSLWRWRRDDGSALMGLLMVTGVAALGALLLFAADETGGPRWPMFVFLALAVGGMTAYGVWVFPYFRRLERRLPEEVERWTRLENKLIAASGHLGAGDLVRSMEQARGLPDRLARVAEGASVSLSALAQQIQDKIGRAHV